MSKEQKKEENTEGFEDIQYDLEDDVVEESGLQDKLKKLRTELKAEKKQSQEYLTGWQTERASFANYKSSEEKSKSERLSSMKVNLIADFFPVLDSFDMAFSNRESWESVDPAWRTGVEYIHTQFMNVLEQYNVQLVNSLNVDFDPMIHEPVETIPTNDESQDNTIAAIIQTGYLSGEVVIRPAKVKVYKYGTTE